MQDMNKKNSELPHLAKLQKTKTLTTMLSQVQIQHSQKPQNKNLKLKPKLQQFKETSASECWSHQKENSLLVTKTSEGGHEPETERERLFSLHLERLELLQ